MGVYDNCYVEPDRFMAILDISNEDYLDCRVYFNNSGEFLGAFINRVISLGTFSSAFFYDLSPFHASLIFEL